MKRIEARDISHNLICPDCHRPLIYNMKELRCSSCGCHYPIIGSIPDFRHKDYYWCNVSREKMQELNRMAEENGDWLESAKKIIPGYVDHFVPFYRADCQFLWPTTKDSRILDAGCMWGGLTIPVAQFHREVYAVDKTIETLEFLTIRAKQMKFDNIFAVAAPIKSLPFSDNFFDLIILNGVLEWVGLEDDTILERHWKGKREGSKIYLKTPEEMQLDVLQEIHRVLKPNGSLCIAIENRYGIQYFLAYPDDHNNVRFVTFLPRFLSNIASKGMGKGEYRTYVYSPGQLDNLLRKSGFYNISMYGIFPHYIKIAKAFPIYMAKLFKSEIRVQGVVPRILHSIINPFIPNSIVRQTIPSLFAICGKSNNKTELIPRVQNLLIKADVINSTDNLHFVISNNRYENHNSANIIIYDHNNCPLYFCKIARDSKISGLQIEAENLNWISNKLSTSKRLSFQIPELIYYGVIDGLTVLVTTFLEVKHIKLTHHYIMNKGFDKIGVNNKIFRKSVAFIEERLFLKRIDRKINQAINSLVEFQRITSNGKTDMRVIANNIIDNYFEYRNNLPGGIKYNVLRLKDEIRSMSKIYIFSCAIHGDYDFDNVLFFTDGKVGLVDFEHLERQGAPFFDLTTLIFNPLIMKWKKSYLRNESFGKYLNQYGAMEYITKWLKYFCDKQHIPYSIIPIIPLLSAIEQNIKIYPSFRDPHTYPMHGESMLKELLVINIDQKYLK